MFIFTYKKSFLYLNFFQTNLTYFFIFFSYFFHIFQLFCLIIMVSFLSKLLKSYFLTSFLKIVIFPLRGDASFFFFLKYLLGYIVNNFLSKYFYKKLSNDHKSFILCSTQPKKKVKIFSTQYLNYFLFYIFL